MKANIFPTIKTDRLQLRQFIESGLENVFKGLSHPDIIKYYGLNFKILEETKEQLIFLPIWRKMKREYGGLYVRWTTKHFMEQADITI